MQRFLPFFPGVFVLLWSTGFIGARFAMPYAEPFTFLSIRFALALVLLAAMALAARAVWPQPRLAMHAMIAGSLIHGVYLGGVFFAVRHGLNAGVAALIVGLQPIITALIASPTLGETIRPRHALGLALGLAGVALVILPKLGAGGDYHFVNVAPACLSALGISLGTIWQKRFATGIDVRTGTFFQYLGALLPSLVLALAFETMAVEWNGEVIFALLWLTVVLSIGAIFLMMILIREGAVSKVASLMYLTPGVTAVMAYLLFGETLTLVQLGGLILAGAGVAAATGRGGRGRQSPRTPA
ncbi:DMT family transporter [Jiella pelagia]|uniref:DMT family transporter n=1 Tax=Jiella pelagia TaxID=2986949 RepID=A0ABY7C2U4_9HYPH|nr:DMT family transporter [Jiella pelagia]WAP69660.1 DMT family transporter [Jiella pelagia]